LSLFLKGPVTASSNVRKLTSYTI